MKQIISLLLLILVLAGVVYTQDIKYVAGGRAREMALGGSPTNPYLMDYYDVFTNPAWASKYADLVYAELGYNYGAFNAQQQTIGFTYGISSGLAIGLSVGNQEGFAFPDNSYGAQFGGNVTNADNMLGGINTYFTGAGFTTPSSSDWRPLQLYTAFKLGGLSVGAAIYRVGWSYSSDYLDIGDTVHTKTEASLGQTGIKVGMLMDMNTVLLDASAMIRFNSGSGKVTPQPPPPGNLSNVYEVTATGTEIAVNARLFMKLSDKFTLVPMARFLTFGYEPEEKYAVGAGLKFNAKPDKYSRTDIEFGVGTNVNVKGGKIFAGISLESISLKHDVTTFVGTAATIVPIATATQTSKSSVSVLSLPKLSVGAEFDIASWLTGRIGYVKAFASRTQTSEPPSVPKTEYVQTRNDIAYMPLYGSANAACQLLSLGLGFNFDRVSINGYLNEKWLADGPFISSGVANAMFGNISLSYSFL
jgi:hypothetical protein